MTTSQSAISARRRWANEPFSPLASVRGRIAAGFILLVAILGSVVGASLWLVNSYRESLAEMEQSSNIASLLEETKTNAVFAGASIEHYILTGDETRLEEVRTRTTAAMNYLTQAAALAGESQAPEEQQQWNRIVAGGLASSAAANQVIAVRQNVGADAAALAMQDALPALNQFWSDLEALASYEHAQAGILRSDADRMGDAAFWSLLLSGAFGAIIGMAASFFIARSILNPLSRLEKVAQSVAGGDVGARATPGGPRELAHLSQTLNYTILTLQEREREILASNEELRERNRQLIEARSQAATDALTNLPNHRSFHETIRGEVEAVAGNGGAISVIMMDIDGFKNVNDTLGHLQGDNILRECADAFCRVVKRELVYRYGGDEFAVLLPGMRETEALEVAEHLRRSIEERREAGSSRLTISLGVASYPETARSAEELVYEADAAMYRAKSAGKNRVGRWHAVNGPRRDTATASPAARRRS